MKFESSILFLFIESITFSLGSLLIVIRHPEPKVTYHNL